MDAKDRLRQYLEQRREMGEREFVLDDLSVDDALRALGVAKGAAPAARGKEATAARDERSIASSVDSAARQAAEQAGADGDWRAALRSIGADGPARASSPPLDEAPEKPREKVGRYEMPTAPAAGDASGPPHANAPAGIVVGHRLDEATANAPPYARLASIDAIAKAVATCTECPLSATAKNPVPGEGNPRAGFVVVGEAPGANEDETGRPFIGAAGQLLTKILAAVNFTREEVFICNVLKHRPPGNRNPSPDEIKACSPYLLRQLELLQPRVILALGSFAAQTLLQTTQPIGKLRGQVHRFYGVPLIVTYHPAALLRNPTWKRPTWEDVQLARRLFDSAASGA